jgi:transcriptional regulator with XRE-family HTH domain
VYILEIFERIKILRNKEYLNLTQEEFSMRIKISRSNLASLETGRINVTDRLISDICREFRVNEVWLRTGRGDIFLITPDDDIERLAVKYNLSDLAKRVVGEFVKLDKDQSNAVLEWLKNVFTGSEISDKSTVTYDKKVHLAAAHNDNLEDPEEQEKVRRDFDKI